MPPAPALRLTHGNEKAVPETYSVMPSTLRA